MEQLNAFTLMLLALAVWRVSSLLVNEAGAWGVFEHLRAFTAGTMIGEALTCVWCTSVWVAAAFVALYLFPLPLTALMLFDAVILLLALSALAIVLQSIVDRLNER